MNIFAVSENPKTAAQMLCDTHVCKMLLETAQLLCNTFPPGEAPYKRTHYYHPCSIWVRESMDNYIWLVTHGEELSKEFEFRYLHEHKSHKVIIWCKNKIPEIPKRGLTSFAQAVPDMYKREDPIEAYRNYYINEKRSIARWVRGRNPPEWWPKSVDKVMGA
jgi:hypothetical protein